MTDISDSVKTLADRALLVRLARKRLRTTIRDKNLEGAVRAQANDDSITVSKHLFRDRNSKVRDLMRKYDEVYVYHKENTLPWMDNGMRLLRSDRYMEYMEGVRRHIAEVEQLLPTVVDNWEQLVADDMAERGAAAQRDEYPQAYDVAEMFAIDVQCFPLPSAKDFRVDVDDETKAALGRALEQAEERGRLEVVKMMLTPIQKAVEKLRVPIGEEGAIFRDSLVENIREGVAQAKALNISDDPQLIATIEEVEQAVSTAIGEDKKAIESLRLNQTQRSKAADQLDSILGKIGLV